MRNAFSNFNENIGGSNIFDSLIGRRAGRTTNTTVSDTA